MGDVIRLRFRADDDFYEFETAPAAFVHRVHDAFVAYRQATGNESGHLEVFHKIHGWDTVETNGVYVIIGNPMTINFEVLAIAVDETMWRQSLRPVPEDESAVVKKRKNERHLRLVK